MTESMKAKGDKAINEAVAEFGATFDGDVVLVPGEPGSLIESIEVKIPADLEMTIFPDNSEIKEVAKLLLELADHPRDVRTTLDPTIGFVVPFWLYENFVATWDLKLGGDTVIRETIPAGEDKPVTAVIEEITEPVARRKPGRPRKEA